MLVLYGTVYYNAVEVVAVVLSSKCSMYVIIVVCNSSGVSIELYCIKQGVKLTFFSVATWLLNILKW